jgi:hypothetical protein
VSPRIQVMYSERLSRTSPWQPPVVWTDFSNVGTSLGVYAFSRSAAGDEALLCAGFPNAFYAIGARPGSALLLYERVAAGR